MDSPSWQSVCLAVNMARILLLFTGKWCWCNWNDSEKIYGCNISADINLQWCNASGGDTTIDSTFWQLDASGSNTIFPSALPIVSQLPISQLPRNWKDTEKISISHVIVVLPSEASGGDTSIESILQVHDEVGDDTTYSERCGGNAPRLACVCVRVQCFVAFLGLEVVCLSVCQSDLFQFASLSVCQSDCLFCQSSQHGSCCRAFCTDCSRQLY